MDNSHKYGINISTSTIIRFFLVAVAILVFYYMFDVVLVVLAAIVIASAIEPIVRRLQHYQVNRIIAVILVYLLMFVIVGAILIFFVPVVLGEIIDFLRNVPSTISLDTVWSPIRDIGLQFSNTPIASNSISMSDLTSGLQSIFIGTGAGAFQAASFIFGGVLSFTLIVVLSFYMAVQREGVENFLRIISPVRHHDYVVGLWKRSQRKIGFWLQGQILLAVIVGVLVYLVLMIVGIPHALLLAVLAGMLEIIPVFGPIIAAVPAVLLAFSDAGVGTALLLVGLYLIIQQFENQLFYPLVVKKIVGISPIVVILALVIGAKVAGILGAILAVPLSAALMEYLDDIEKSKNVERGIA